MGHITSVTVLQVLGTELFIAVLSASGSYPAEVNPVHPSFFSEGCPDRLDIQVKFTDNEVPLQLRHNSELQTQMVPIIIWDGTEMIRQKHQVLPDGLCFYHDARTETTFSVQRHTGHSVLFDGRFTFQGSSYHLSHSGEGNHHVTHLGKNFEHPDSKKAIPSRLKRAEKTHYKVEVLMCIDFTIYRRWFDSSDATTPEAKNQEAQDNIRYYFAHILNDMDLRFQNIETPDYDVRVSLAGFMIANTTSAFPWTDKFRETQAENKDISNVTKVLIEFTEWIIQHTTQLPPFDHATLFTGLDLYSGRTTGDLSNIGSAVVGGVCQYNRTSVVEDRGRFSSGYGATHELAHNLGAVHDGENNTCSAADHYIMIPTVGGLSLNFSNMYRFSSCSIQEMKTRMSQWTSRCLLSTSGRYDQKMFANYLTELPGQKYDIFQQCKAVFGEQSRFCGDISKREEICKSIICSNPKDGHCYQLRDTPAARGTTCGNKKWCENGECVFDVNAPTANEECLFGDYGGLIQPSELTCPQLVAREPWMCYHDDNRKLCCGSCAKIEKPENQGCEYGNKALWCATLSRRSCYSNDNACCETCAAYKTGPPGCEYGDSGTGCSEPLCVLPANKPICCETCGVTLPTTSTSSTTTNPTNSQTSTQTTTKRDSSAGSSTTGPSRTTTTNANQGNNGENPDGQDNTNSGSSRNLSAFTSLSFSCLCLLYILCLQLCGKS